MSIDISIIKINDSSKMALSTIFDPENIVACANYGGGVHCNPEKVAKKIELWGKRGDEAVSEDQCMLARIISIDAEPAAMLNIGKPDSPATVIDKTQKTNQFVYEISGLMVRDKFQGNAEIANAVKDIMSTCKVDDNYTKVIATFSPIHPYQENFLLSAGAVKLTTENVISVLGNNSLHPECFKFEGAQLQECSRWDEALAKITHEGWDDSEPCIEWLPKTACVFNVVDGHIEIVGMSVDGTPAFFS